MFINCILKRSFVSHPRPCWAQWPTSAGPTLGASCRGDAVRDNLGRMSIRDNLVALLSTTQPESLCREELQLPFT